MAQPTNKQLQNEIQAVDNKQTTFEKYVKNKFRDWSPKIDAMHDYLIGQEAISKDKNNRGIAITPDVIKIILWLIAIIGGLVGVTNLPK